MLPNSSITSPQSFRPKRPRATHPFPQHPWAGTNTVSPPPLAAHATTTHNHLRPISVHRLHSRTRAFSSFDLYIAPGTAPRILDDSRAAWTSTPAESRQVSHPRIASHHLRPTATAPLHTPAYIFLPEHTLTTLLSLYNNARLKLSRSKGEGEWAS